MTFSHAHHSGASERAVDRVRLRRLSQFKMPYRRFIGALTSCSARLEELSDSFPALVFALATGYGSPNEREKCFDFIERGRSLKDAAAVLGLPWWLKKLPASAFTLPLRPLPEGTGFSRRIGNHVPEFVQDAGPWFERVQFAYGACNEGFALWTARQHRFPFRERANDPYVLLAAWAWHSCNPQAYGASLIRRPWAHNISLKSGYDEARHWARRIDLSISLGDGVDDSWFNAGSALGYDFHPLLSTEEFLAESKAMENCLDQYADTINAGNVRVFSISKNNVRIANLELAPHEDDCAMPTIEQLRAPRNTRADPEIWRAAYAWLGGQPFRPHPIHNRCPNSAVKAWKRVWAPYLHAIECPETYRRVLAYAEKSLPLVGEPNDCGDHDSPVG